MPPTVASVAGYISYDWQGGDSAAVRNSRPA